MATPYLDEAERCSRVALLHEGRLLALDAPSQLRAALPGRLFEVIATDHRRAADLIGRLPNVSEVQMFGERVHVRVEAGFETAAELAAALGAIELDVESVRPIATSLEDVFIARLGERRVSAA
jgi:ABC-2 type transport system ATP-binding protein